MSTLICHNDGYGDKIVLPSNTTKTWFIITAIVDLKKQ